MALNKYPFLILGFFLLASLQGCFSLDKEIFGFSLNIYAVILFLAIFFSRERPALIMSFWAGLFLDIFSFSYFGLFAFTLFLSTLFVKEASRIFKKTNAAAFFILFILFLLAYNLFLLIGNFLFGLI